MKYGAILTALQKNIFKRRVKFVVSYDLRIFIFSPLYSVYGKSYQMPSPWGY